MQEKTAGAALSSTDPKDTSPLASRVRYLVLTFACILAAMTYIQRQAFPIGMSEIKKSLGFDDGHMSSLHAAFLIAYGLFQVPGGLLGDRLGGRRVLTLLVLGWSLLTGAVAAVVLLPAVVVLQFGFLLLLRFLFGALQAGGFPVLGRIMADWIPVTQRGAAQGAIWMLSRVGGAVIPFMFAWLLALCGGWRVPFVLLAGPGLLWCAAFWPWFRNKPEEMKSVNEAERQLIAAGRPQDRFQPPGVPWSSMAGSRSVWALCLMYGFTGFSGNFFTGLLPLYLSDHRHLLPDETKWLTSLPLAGGVVSCVLGGYASDRLIRRWGSRKWGRRAVGMTGLALAGLTILLIPWVEDVWLLGLVLTASFFCNDLTMGPAWASCADIGERYAGTLSGTMNMIGAFAGAAGAKLTGYLLLHGQPQILFIIFAGVYVTGALCWLGVDVTKRLTAPT